MRAAITMNFHNKNMLGGGVDYWHISFQNPTLSGIAVAPTSVVHALPL
jgi:hypothetical protein